jgi:hypothetical protein
MSLLKRALVLSLGALLLNLPLSALAQWDKKPSSDWNERETQKVLNDSPWGRTQVFTSPVTMFRQPVTGSQGVRLPNAPQRPADATHVNFRIRFLSAKPIREATARLMELKQAGKNEDIVAQLQPFVRGEFHELIVITVNCDAAEAGANASQALGLLHSRGTAELKNNTFLEIKGGRRVFLQEFQSPKQDGLGARFIFPRQVDGRPFITPEAEEIRFFTELSGDYKLDRRFKTKDMVYAGKLEY